MPTWYVNVEWEMADGTLEYEWYSTTAKDEDYAIDKVLRYIMRRNGNTDWCRIKDVQNTPPVLIIDID